MGREQKGKSDSPFPLVGEATYRATIVLTCKDALMPRAQDAEERSDNPFAFPPSMEVRCPVGEPSETSVERGHRLKSPAPRQGERFFGYFLIATRKYLAHPGETGLVRCRRRRHVLSGRTPSPMNHLHVTQPIKPKRDATRHTLAERGRGEAGQAFGVDLIGRRRD